MTTYYGVWSGKEWYRIDGGELFYAPALEVAKAQAVAANAIWKAYDSEGHWEARAIGEDGLPAEQKRKSLSKVYCSECGKLVGEEDLRKGYIISATCLDCRADDFAMPINILRAEFGVPDEGSEDELPRQRSRLIVCKPCDLERCAAVLNATELTEAAPHECAMCGEPAKEWVDVHIRGWMCEKHRHVKMGCFSKDWRNDYVIKDSRKYVFCDQKGCWLGFPMEEEESA